MLPGANEKSYKYYLGFDSKVDWLEEKSKGGIRDVMIKGKGLPRHC